MAALTTATSSAGLTSPSAVTTSSKVSVVTSIGGQAFEQIGDVGQIGTWPGAGVVLVGAVESEFLIQPAQRIELQHQLGKLTARERIEYLADRESFEELGSLVREFRFGLEGEAKPSPSDGVIMGHARVLGRPVMVYAMDFTVMSGSIGDQGVWKIAELVQMAADQLEAAGSSPRPSRSG